MVYQVKLYLAEMKCVSPLVGCHRHRCVFEFLFTFECMGKRSEIGNVWCIVQRHFQSFAFGATIFEPKLNVFTLETRKLLPEKKTE